MEYSSIFNFCSVTSANLTKVYRMKEIFSSFFSSANIIVRAALTFLCFLQLPLQGALVVYIRLPRAMPWAMDDIGLSARTGYGRYWAFLLRQAAKPSAARQPHLCFHANLHMLFPPIGRVKSLFPAI